MTYTIPFTHLNKNDIPTAGGKGANLGELTAAGFPVPVGFVVETAVYNQFTKTHNLQQKIIDIANAVLSNDPQSSQSASEKIQQLFMNADILDEIAAEIVSAWQALGTDAVAVRSSATAEDLPSASFAGQQDSFLNIRDEAALLEAVKKCWASLWTARAITYRHRQNIDPASISLAVVIQTLIPAEASGILFTANPVTGERDQMLINGTWGLGEAIVGGLVTPDSLVVTKADWQVHSRETSTKTVMTVRTEQGTEEVPVALEKQDVAVLADETAVSLAKLGAQIETHYQMPMDIEWAIINGQISILQARPITSMPAEPLKNVTWEPPTPNTIWMRRQIVEHMPDPLSPLFEDVYLHGGMAQTIEKLMNSFAQMGGARLNFDEMMPHGFADTINGYAYTTGSFTMTWDNFVAIVKIYSRIYKFFSLSAFDWDNVVLPQYQALIARWAALDLDTISDEALLQGIIEMAGADSSYWFGSAVNLGASRGLDPLFDKLLKSPLIRHALPRPQLGSSSFLRGFDSKALDAQADMESIADTIRASAELRQLVLNTAPVNLHLALSSHPDGQSVSNRIQSYLDAYGHQIYNLDFVDPTPSEEPLAVLLSLKALVENAPTQPVRARQAQMAAERDTLIEQTVAALNPVTRPLFEWVWKWTKKYAPYRESVMFYMGSAWPTVRKLANELGQRFTAVGAINAPDDIYYLQSGEITAVITARAQEQPIPNFVPLAEERRALREGRKLLTPMPKVPENSSLKVGPIDISMFDPTPSDAGGEGAVLSGYAVSTGRITAPASVIHSIEDFDKMAPNSILVCTTTTPAWTPLFSQAVGLVTDVGGALAHGSIVAREYGIPAVMGTGIATERIQSGMMLAVDGDAGTVTLLDEVDEALEARLAAEKLVAEEEKRRKKTAVIVAVIGFIIGLIWWKRRK